jgi:tRNA A37 threonylcarbamoyladenosine dehydratase
MNDNSWLNRTHLLIGDAALHKLSKAHVMVVGLGGVGSYAAEFIARSGVGTMTIVDGDVVEESNRNRQLLALFSTTGKNKAQLMAERLNDINPAIELNIIEDFIHPDMVEKLLSLKPDYILDAIDSITPKITLLVQAYHQKLPLVSCMGAGGKTDLLQIKIADISKTFNCPFAQEIRKQLKMKYQIKNGINTVFSPEIPPKESLMLTDGNKYKKSSYGTISYMPAAMGGVAASVVIKDLIKER